ncbi:MAG: hypothetical protein MdMp024_1838 [Bacteroidales bacterium]
MLIKKIDKAKWFSGDIINEPPSADAITNCLNTKQNKLSVWRINNESELKEAVLAIVSGQDHLETIDVVMLDDDYFVEHRISAEAIDGRTPVEDLKHTHRNLCSLNLLTLGMVAEHVVENIKNDKLKRFTRAQLKDIITDAVTKKRLNFSDLKEDIQKKIHLFEL